MDGAISKITEAASDAIKNTNELIRERLFSPMYFYFLIAWVVTNWKFVYVLLFVEEETIIRGYRMLKVDYLEQMYQCGWWSVAQLLVIPAVSTFVIVWWFSKLSEMFFKKHETHLMNKRAIKSELEYTEKYKKSKSERAVREVSEAQKIKYEDNRDFNDSLDEQNPDVIVSSQSLLPSEVLYNTDYQAYVDQLDEWRDYQAQKGEDLVVQEEIDRRRGK